MFELVIWILGIITNKLALVSLDFDKRAKSCEGLKFRGQTAKKIFTDGSQAKN